MSYRVLVTTASIGWALYWLYRAVTALDTPENALLYAAVAVLPYAIYWLVERLSARRKQ
jgi:hypothetical protein